MKLYESPLLNYSQMQRLKTAEAIYEVVPIVLLSPYALYMLKFTAKFQMSISSLSRLIGYLACGGVLYMGALHQ